MSENKPGKRKQRPALKSLLLLVILRFQGRIGRYRLKNMLNLSGSEGVVRLMLNDLKRVGYIEVDRAGCSLTEKGKALLQRSLERHNIIAVKDVDLRLLGLESKCIAIQIRGRQLPQKIIELRDTAVRAGADGAILIYNQGGLLKIPAVYDNLDLEYPRVVEELHKTFDISNSDIFLIGFSKDRWRALEGSLAAAERIEPK